MKKNNKKNTAGNTNSSLITARRSDAFPAEPSEAERLCHVDMGRLRVTTPADLFAMLKLALRGHPKGSQCNQRSGMMRAWEIKGTTGTVRADERGAFETTTHWWLTAVGV